jgi:glycine/D-amino acid oxidase-like deaminating enzyme/nitrite reductase/ring-hydroxylating ferredoxin subunit
MNNATKPLTRDGQQNSPWQHGLPQLDKAATFTAGTVYDCLIIGGGITGLTAALLLQQAGKKTILTEVYNIGFGTTGGTTAHINTFADTSYTDAEKAFGQDGAKLFAGVVSSGLTIIKENITKYQITCEFEEKPGYIYAETDKEVKQLEDLLEGLQKVGVSAAFTNDVPTPVAYKKALLLPGQAQFHPLSYLQALAAEYVNAGGTILENTRVDDIESNDGIHTAKALNIAAKSVIYATHMPPGINTLNLRCAPYRSYALGLKLTNNAYPDALIYDMQDPYHYTRTHVMDGEPILIIGGNDHKTGHDDPEQAFADLENYARKYYDVASVAYKWSSQYYVPVDGLPYVGQMPMRAEGIYCATGYNGNGMMLGTTAGAILSDLICEKENPYAELLSVKRLKPIDGFVEFVKENTDVAYHFVADRLSVQETESLNSLQPGNGEVVEFDGKKIAAYKDEAGKIHALSPICPHMKCVVSFNAEEKSWDCPCHGARFDINGTVITGPAMHNLDKIEL